MQNAKKVLEAAKRIQTTAKASKRRKGDNGDEVEIKSEAAASAAAEPVPAPVGDGAPKERLDKLQPIDGTALELVLWDATSRLGCGITVSSKM